jgi:hypothetical protein
MNQPPEPGQQTRQSPFSFIIPSIIIDGGSKYPPFLDVRAMLLPNNSKLVINRTVNDKIGMHCRWCRRFNS